MTAWPQPKTPDVARLVRLIGPEATFELLEAKGGITIYIPRQACQGMQLEEIIGDTAARKLIEAFGGLYYRVPLERQWRILVYRGWGCSYSEIARKVGCTESAVWSTLNRHGMTGQLDLFGGDGDGATTARSATTSSGSARSAT